jgi:hypothetical protein
LIITIFFLLFLKSHSQANGWGFRRITQGRDRNSYYHPLFLRGLPHHCKKMKRPGVSQKQTADPDHEPDLYKISEMHPIPENAAAGGGSSYDDSILLHCTLQGGPKARMPIYSGAMSAASKNAIMSSLNGTVGGSMGVGGMMMMGDCQLTPRDQAALSGFQNALGASEDHFKNMANGSNNGNNNNNINTTMMLPGLPLSNLIMAAPPNSMLSATAVPQQQLPAAMTNVGGGLDNKLNPLAIANQLAFTMDPSQMAAAFQASSAATQFAAGFAAATALSHQQFQSMLGSLMQQQQQQLQQQASGDGGGGVMPVAASPAATAAAPQQQQQQDGEISLNQFSFD